MIEKSPRLLRIEEVGVRLGKSTGSVRSLINQGILRTIKLGRNVRVPEDWLEAFIQKNTRPERVA